ncbi:hypothetical protein [Microcoleus sp. PH2017_30_WIL_O_A]|uniref:hypothetical protein n=1 Tax=Microcoleus sp. PH2017_30_WIL_O_A TaxID=2798840 RepID=UPI001DD1AEC9|nr:hypothetical protein [Microcoleus sp. PH2017_30_WIL_O_A]MCC3582613.1 hypothetical protein [Microcoleus sp. PH2017_30_WIL_O_A]
MNNLAKAVSGFKLNLRLRLYLAIAALAVLLLLGFSLFRNLYLTNPNLPTWSNASQIEPSFLSDVVRDNYITSAGVETFDKSKMEVLRLPFVSSSGRGSAQVFRFNSQNLCGAGGCLYSIYIDRQKVLSTLLRSFEPKFKFLEVVNKGMPCLAIAQKSIDNSGEVESQYCWFGSSFLRVE